MPALGHAYHHSWAGIMENSTVIMPAQYVCPVCILSPDSILEEPKASQGKCLPTFYSKI